ncbi:uncharacterized protein LOC143527667 [Brachyhypopomus gauderio]|uniref:uncharacterized protein LOC143527667 n=1 Tax=Brachyhypopomus gauderio TaxID=698409 RepID=UPI0040432C68
MAVKNLTTVKDEEVFPPVKEEPFESELCFPCTKSESEFSSDILKQEPFHSYKKEEPVDFTATPPLEVTTKQEGEEHPESEHEKNVGALQCTEDNVATWRMQLRYRPCRGKPPDASQSPGHSRETSDTSHTPVSPHCRLGSNGRPTRVRQPPGRPRGRPKKHSAHAQAVCEQRGKINSKDLRRCNSATNQQMAPRRSLCETCGKAFLSARDLERHERTHTGAKPFACDVCGRRFNDRGNMHKHVTLHAGERPYRCLLCGRAFSEKGNLRRHELYVHEVRGEGSRRSYESLWHQCPTCLRTFKYHRSLIRHMDAWCQRKRHSKGKETKGNAGKSDNESQSAATE